MNFLLSIVILFTFALFYISLQAFKKKKYSLFLFTIFTIFYVFIRQIMLLSGNYINYAILSHTVHDFSIDAIMVLDMYIFISYIFFYFSYKYFYSKDIGRVYEYNKDRDYGKIVILAIGIFQILIFSSINLVYIMYLFIYNYYKNNRYKVFIFVSFFILIYFFTYTDDRRNWLFLVLSLMFMYFVKSKNQKIIKILIFGGGALLIMSYIAIAFRTDGLFNYSAVESRIVNNSDALMGILEIETDFPIVSDDLILLFDKIVIEDKIDYTYGKNFFKPLYAFIPREVWVDKPITISRLFSKKFNKWFYDQGGSEPITIYGELFWNFGFLSFPFYIIIGLIATFFDKKLYNSLIMNNDSELSFYIAYISLGFVVLRGPLDNFWLMYFSVFILIQLERVIPFFLRNINAKN